MSKPRTSWVSGERPALSSKQNQQTIDYMTPGLPIFNVVQWFDSSTTDTPRATHYLGWYPYNASKSVFNTLRLMFGVSVVGAVIIQLQVSFDSGGSWTNAMTGAGASPVPLDPIVSMGSPTSALSRDWDLTGIAGFQWIGIRIDMTVVVTYSLGYLVQGFLWNTTDNPF